ncbi:hypothetical protein FO519_006039 [Halicephalobus sp. NKZ332]|nr:hypothetical protein FO519_006039 [Halicephalobus sp. NKZ332]
MSARVPRRGKISRSVSLNTSPKRNPITVSPIQPICSTNLPRWRTPTLRSKVVKFMTTKMFLNQVGSETAQFPQSSSFHIFFIFMRIIGASYRIRKKEPKWLMVFLMFYNLIMFVWQVIYGILLLVGLRQSSDHSHQWTNVTHFSSLVICVTGIWMNLKLHTIKPKMLDEALSSSSLNEKHVEKRSFLLKVVSVVCITTILTVVIIVETLRMNSDDRFGIYSLNTYRMPIVFTCGIRCRLLESFFHGVCTCFVLTSAALFLVLSTAISTEASGLISDIRKYPTSQGLDHLIYRYQSIERSTTALDKTYSVIIFSFMCLSITGMFFSLRKKAKLMIYEGETGGINVAVTMVTFLLAILAIVVFAIYLNEQLDEFRSAAHKVSDLQQVDLFCITSIKLLSFMLRLCDNKERIKSGGIFIISKQSTLTLILFFSLVGFCVFAIDEGCLNLF